MNTIHYDKLGNTFSSVLTIALTMQGQGNKIILKTAYLEK